MNGGEKLLNILRKVLQFVFLTIFLRLAYCDDQV